MTRLLGSRSGLLRRRWADWPHLLEGPDDIRQQAAVGFVQAAAAGRIRPDAQAGAHTADSVAAYAWGIVNRLFANAVSRSRPQPLALDAAASDGSDLPAGPPGQLEALESLTAGGPGDSDSRLWEVLRAARGGCRPEDIIVSYLLASGISVAELRAGLGVSENTPANALRRVGRELRRLLDSAEGRP